MDIKKITTFSLFVFVAVAAGVFFVNLFSANKDKGQSVVNANAGDGNINQTSNISGTSTTPKITGIKLTSAELAKHKDASSCWLLISGKIYNITSYLGSHPGGEAEILKTCGTDATAIYNSKDGTGTHSSQARAMLANYYIGDLNQVVKTKSSANSGRNAAPSVANPNFIPPKPGVELNDE